MTEAVVFLFKKNNNVLLEYRSNKGGKFNDVFITSGKIEEIDKQNQNYSLAAMLREIKEEFQNRIIPVQYTFVGKFSVKEIDFLFYIFIINKWEGTLPKYTVENGQKYARLSWHSLPFALSVMKYPSGIYALQKAMEKN